MVVGGSRVILLGGAATGKSPWFHLISSYSVLLSEMGYTQKADMKVRRGLEKGSGRRGRGNE